MLGAVLNAEVGVSVASRIFKNHSLWRTETKQSGCTSNYNLEWVYKLLPYYKVTAAVKNASQRSAGPR